MSSPLKRTRPRRGGVKPMIERIRVVLPIPSRPRIVTTSPGPTESVMPWSTWLSPSYVWTSLSASIVASCAEVDLAHQRVRPHVLARAVGDHAPVVEHGDMPADLEREVHAVLDA